MEPEETPKTQKYRVFKANIMDDNGQKVLQGDVVELSPALAKRYNKLGYLRPYIEDDEDDEIEPAPTARSRRLARKLSEQTARGS